MQMAVLKTSTPCSTSLKSSFAAAHWNRCYQLIVVDMWNGRTQHYLWKRADSRLTLETCKLKWSCRVRQPSRDLRYSQMRSTWSFFGPLFLSPFSAQNCPSWAPVNPSRPLSTLARAFQPAISDGNPTFGAFGAPPAAEDAPRFVPAAGVGST
mmetsp:Transcript_23528/g.73252  ORF Transcript_23528/g.73252 Transcript_23528/m.73252 type:complete len:153 (+) Transcript_23528:162-620(+)